VRNVDANSTVDDPAPSARTVRTVVVKSAMPSENSFWVLYGQHTEPTFLEEAGNGQQPQRNASLKYVEQWRTAIDVGANVGEWTRALAKKFDYVICFEPNPNFRECFNRNITESNVTLYPYGLSTHAHTAEQGTNHTYLNYVVGDTKPRKGDIECRSLDSFDLHDVDYIKIDVDGFEIPVLRGAQETLKRNNPVINIEMKERKRPKIVEESRRILRNLGYNSHSRVRSDEVWLKP
jgi:FkbM family methyltransferase